MLRGPGPGRPRWRRGCTSFARLLLWGEFGGLLSPLYFTPNPCVSPKFRDPTRRAPAPGSRAGRVRVSPRPGLAERRVPEDGPPGGPARGAGGVLGLRPRELDP